jgi:hypothetical protein
MFAMDFKKGISGINLIVSAVIGLIIIIVIIMMLTGKLGAFGEGTESAVSCENICKSLGYDLSGVGSGALSKAGCEILDKSTVLPGKFGDIPERNSEGIAAVCCCYNQAN